jgi:hypothetical protein
VKAPLPARRISGEVQIDVVGTKLDEGEDITQFVVNVAELCASPIAVEERTMLKIIRLAWIRNWKWLTLKGK